VVANTSDNLIMFERILAELNVVPSQIEIESRFVEVAQRDLTSLGFEWLLTDDWEIAQKKGNYPLTGRPRVQIDKNSIEDSLLPGDMGGFTRGNRYVPHFPVEMYGYQDDVMRITSILTNPELSLIIHAMEQKGNADLLSAPKVTTQAGEEATIKVVTEYIYPTDFDVTPITGTDANGNSIIVGGVVEPSGFETREVGVILAVVPDVQQEGAMIALTLAPEVVSEPEWRDYGSTYTAADGTTQTLPMEQPFFHTRMVSTKIIIYNGATVVMGGMINEVRNTVDDQIPFLGDIPILGRLFQSKIDRSEKRNLLIFVTARLVGPDGLPIERAGETLTSVVPSLPGGPPGVSAAPGTVVTP
jgi:general secretion pathway protein D